MSRIKGALEEGKTSQHICFKDSSILPSKYHLLARTTSLKLKIGTRDWNQSQWRTVTWGTIPFLAWLVHVFKYMLSKKNHTVVPYYPNLPSVSVSKSCKTDSMNLCCCYQGSKENHKGLFFCGLQKFFCSLRKTSLWYPVNVQVLERRHAEHGMIPWSSIC